MQIENPYVQYMYSYPHKTSYRALRDIDLRSYCQYLREGPDSLYFHIPFCQYKCGYCNLFSLAGRSVELMEAYVNAMERQAAQLQQILPEDVYFSDLTVGGGTPLILPEDLLERVFRIAREYFGFSKDDGLPVVVETSPNQTTEPKVSLLKEQGVTRVSIGVQSFQEKELQALSRFHTAKAARQALELIKQAEFSCVNIDLIYGIPGQTRESLLDSLAQALSYEPEELFVYPLYVKRGTGMYQRKQRSCADPEMYMAVRETLKAHGYYPCSMRRFVRRHIINTKNNCAFHEPNLSLCGFGNTLSVGCGGRSYLGNLHYCTPYAVSQECCESLVREYIGRTDYLQVSYGYLLPEEEQRRRYVIRHILFGTGLVKEDYHRHFGSDPVTDFPQLAEWTAQGYAVEDQKSILLTEEGFALSDYLGPQLISPEVAAKMRKWEETDGAEKAMVL